MNKLTLLGAVAAMTLVFASGSSYAAGRGWGPCTQPGNSAVGADGPAMNSGQLMAGTGQCQRIGRRARNSDAYDYYGGPVERSWGRPDGYWDGGYRDAPTVWGAPVYQPY